MSALLALAPSFQADDFSPRRLQTFPEEAVERLQDPKRVLRSADDRSASYLERLGRKERIVRDGKEGETYDEIRDVLFGPGGRLAYVGRRDRVRRVVVDDAKGEFFNGVRGLTFSPDGKKLAYVATIFQDEEVVVVDQARSDVYPLIAVHPQFAPDGSLVYLAAGRRESTLVVGERELQHRAVSLPVFSGDGRRMAYVAVTPEGRTVFVDGERKADGFRGVASSSFSPDGKRFAFKAQKDLPWQIVVDDKVVHEYEGTSAEHELPPNTAQIVFSPDGRAVAFMGFEEGKRTLLLDGRKKAEGDDLVSPLFSPDGRSIACIARKGDRLAVAHDGRPGKPYDHIDGLSFSADGGAVGYRARKDKKWVVVADGKAGEEYDEVGLPVFRPNSRTAAYSARSGKEWFLIVGAKRFGPHAWVGPPRFSPDGKKVAFGAFEARHHEWKAADLE